MLLLLYRSATAPIQSLWPKQNDYLIHEKVTPMLVSIKVLFLKLLFIAGLFFYGPAPLSAATEKVTTTAETKVVATVDGKPIFLSEILQMAQRLPDQYKQMSLEAVYPSLLSRAIDSKLVSLEGRRSGFSENPEVKKRLNQIEDQIISEIF